MSRAPEQPQHVPVGEAQRIASLRVLSRFLRLARHRPWLTQVNWGLDPCKEVTEAWAVADEAIARAWAIGLRSNDRTVRALVVGDGPAPRTGALLIARTGWQVVACDPQMRTPVAEVLDADGARLTCLRRRVEEVEGVFDLVLATHSHAPVAPTLARLRRGGIAVALPCCVAWPDGERRVVDDCLSPHRTLVVWQKP